MPNTRVCISMAGFLSGFMLIWLLITWVGLGPANGVTASPLRVVYFLFMFALFGYFWIYFFRRPRGDKTLLDGRTALSGCAFIVGVTTGYALIEFGIVATRAASEHSAGGFAIFVGCTLLPILIWLVVSINSLHRRNTALRSQSQS